MEIQPEMVLRGRYRVVRLLGQGGMGAVYLAYDIALDHEVAVKVNHSQTPAAANQFIAEARLLATLRHPSLPRVIDYFLESQSQYLVMDYIAGEDLKTLLERMGALPVEQVLEWAEQLGSALGYLHRQTPPIFHRDIKPANLKLSAENEVILVDFGIAKVADAGQATQAGASGYTPGYAPPEQYGGGRTGAYSDQYAMAATLYHLLTGQKPADAVQRVLGQAGLPSAQALNPALPGQVSLALDRALSIRPEERFGSVDEFLRALADPDYQSTLRQTPGIAPVQATLPMPQLNAPGAVRAAQPEHKRNKISFWGIGIAAFLVVAAGATGFLLGGGLPPAAAQPSATPPPTLSATLAAPAALAPTLTVAGTPAGAGSPTPSPTLPATPSPAPTATLAPSPSPVPPTRTPAPTATVPAATIAPTAAPPLFGKARALAFVSDRGDGKTLQVWTMTLSLNAQGQAVAGGLTQLTTDPGDKQQPAWSPDGSRLLYVGPGGTGPKGEAYGLDVFGLDLAAPAAKPVNLTHRGGDDTDPAWSPDGKRIALTNNGRGDKVRMIDLMDANGGNLRRLSVDLEEFSPAWSPDGQWLAYVVFARENNVLYRRGSADDFASYEFIDNKAISGRTGQAASPAWSPDGSRLAFVRLELQGEGRIMSMDAATRGDKIVTLTTSGLDRQPAWSPDSQWLAFSSRRDGNFEIYLMRSAGQERPFNLSASPGRDLWPAWRP